MIRMLRAAEGPARADDASDVPEVVADGGRPLRIRGVLNLLPLQGVLPTVKVDIGAPLGNPRHCRKILGYRNVHGRIAECAAWPCDDMTDLAHRVNSSPSVSNMA